MENSNQSSFRLQIVDANKKTLNENFTFLQKNYPELTFRKAETRIIGFGDNLKSNRFKKLKNDLWERANIVLFLWSVGYKKYGMQFSHFGYTVHNKDKSFEKEFEKDWEKFWKEYGTQSSS